MSTTIRIGTRASVLARTQTQTIADALQGRGVTVEIVPMTSDGDRTRASLSSLGGAGVFAAGLRTALLEGRCDAVVHSLKDLPTTPHPGLVVAATPDREAAEDVLCARDGMTITSLPKGAVIGTGSPRRAAQIRMARADLQVRDIRGNIDTRMGFVRDGELDAVVLAAAGLHRTDRTDAITQTLPLEVWPTAPGQGALAVEIRESDAESGTELYEAVRSVHNAQVWDAVTAERAVLARLEAGCAAPVGAHGTVSDGVLNVSAAAYHPTERAFFTARGQAPVASATELGADLATQLLQSGASEWLPTT